MKALRTAALMLGAVLGAHAQSGPPPPRFVQRLGSTLPLESSWTDEIGRPVTLGSCFAPGEPAVVVFGYFKCPQLCSVVERNAVDLLRTLKPTVGKNFQFIYLDIDPTDTPEDARGERAAAARAYGRGDSLEGWHYLSGKPDAIRAAAEAAGFEFRYDRVLRQYAHPAGFLVATPGGVVSRYFLGLQGTPDDVAEALRRAARGETGEAAFTVLLECFRGGAGANPRERLIWDGLWAGVLLTVAGLGGGIGWMLFDERRQRRAP